METLAQAMNGPAFGSAGWLLLWLVKGTLLLAVLFGVAALLRRAASSTRHTVWTAGLGVALLLPVASLDLLPLRIEVPAPVSELLPPMPSAAGDVATNVPDVSSSMPEISSVASAEAPMQTKWTGAAVLRALFAIWAVGAALLLLRLVGSAVRLRRLVRNGTTVTDAAWTRPLFEAADRLDLADAPRLLVSEHAAMPFTCGVRDPVIVLPVSAAEWSDERRRAVLLHELAHIRRHDIVTHMLGRVTCALYWFQPLAWSAARRLRAESERACDDLVLATGTRASAYADHLLQIVTAARQNTAPAVALPMAQAREFETRLLSILAPALRREPATRRQSLALGGLVLAIALPLMALSPARPPQEAGIATQPETEQDQEVGDVAIDSQDPAPDPRPEPRAEPHPDTEVEREIEDAAERGSAAVSALLGRHGGQQEDPRVRAALMEALRGQDAEVRRIAAWSLSNHPDTTVVRALAAALATDAVADVREMSAWSLAELGRRDPRALQALSRAVETDSDASVRAMAVWAIAQLHGVSVVGTVERALGSDSSERVRSTAAWALGELGRPSSVNALAVALGSGHLDTREHAAWALGQIAERPAPAALITALRDENAGIRTVAAWSLGQIEDPAAADALAALLDDPDTDVQKAALWALGNMPAGASVDALTAALRSSDAEVRKAAAAALGGRGSWPWPWPRPRPIVRINP